MISTAASKNPIVLIDYTPLTHTQKIKNELFNFPTTLKVYILSFFPIFQWIHRYNFSWLVQDVIAGVTVGMLIVPQGIAYAKIANLDPQYGLYTSFVGVTLYCFFGTSKDISIGPITVVSLLVGQAVSNVTKQHPEFSGPEVAVCLSLFVGLITLFIGFIKLGILVDFISEPAIAGYMTGSAITISFGQWPKVFGLSSIVNTRDPPYLILVHFLQHLNSTHLDAVFGLVALIFLYMIKFGGVRLSRSFPILKKPLFFVGIMRSGLVVVLGTLISFAINRSRQPAIISIIQTVPAGFEAMAVPSLNWTILNEASGTLPSIIIILILEHVSVAKSFGRMNNYVIDPNQEILAIGMSNIIGSFFGAYPCTGAFSRTAVMARSGAKTPMAGIFSGAVVVLALYILTPAFYYIPDAVLAAVVIHAVVDLVAGPTFLKALWKTSIVEFLIFVVCVIITFFIDVETGIYVAIGLSLFLMLLRLARPTVSSLGRVKLNVGQHHPASPSCSSSYHHGISGSISTRASSSTLSMNHHAASSQTAVQRCIDPSITSTTNAVEDIYGMDKQARYIYIEEKDTLYDGLFDPLPPGIIVIRLSNSILYPNANYVSECISDIVKSHTRSGNSQQENKSIQSSSTTEETTWNQPQPSSKKDVNHRHIIFKPYLECIVLDFSAVDRLDATALHTLHSVKEAMDRHAGGKAVEWHFCHIPNYQVRQLLIQSGFGLLPKEQAENDIKDGDDNDMQQHVVSMKTPQHTFVGNPPLPPFFSSAVTADDVSSAIKCQQQLQQNDTIVLLPIDQYPAFHWDVEAAVYSICERRQYNYQNNHSSITVTTSY